MGNGGFIKLYRKMREWGWYSDPPTKDVFLHLLILAQYEETFYRGVHLKIGDVVATYPDIAEACGLSIKNVRTAIDHLKATGEVAVTRYPKFSVYTVHNYSHYQDGGSLNGSQVAVKRQSNGSHPDIKETKKQRSKEISSKALDDEFEQIWADYPRKAGKKDARRHYAAARKRGVTFEQIRAGVIAYRDYCKKSQTEMCYIKAGSTYFCGEHWNDVLVYQPKIIGKGGYNKMVIPERDCGVDIFELSIRELNEECYSEPDL